MFSEYEKMGLGKPAKPDRLPHFSPQALTRLRQPGRVLRECLKKCKALERDAEEADHAAKEVHEQVAAALNERQATDLTSATEEAGNLVNQLRRRMQMDERLEQMSRNEKELQEQAQALLQKQVPAGNTTVALGLIFVVGVLIISLGMLVFPAWTGTGFWTLAAVGLTIATGGVLVRYTMLRANDQQLEEAQNQLRLLQMQIKQAKDERAVLDDQLPRGGGPMASRLAAAERELAALEDLAPLDSRHAAARKTLPRPPGTLPRPRKTCAADTPGASAWKRRACRRSSRPGIFARWRGWPAASATCSRAWRHSTKNSASAAASATCSTAAWPNSWPTAASKSNRSIPWRRSWSFPRRSRGKRPKSPAATSSAAACGSSAACGPRASRYSPGCSSAASSCCGNGAQRAKRTFGGWRPKPPELRTCDRSAKRIEHELCTTIGNRASEAQLKPYLEGPAAAHLDSSRDDLRTRLAGIEKEILQRVETRGRLTAQMKSLAGDRELAGRQLDLAVLQQRMDEAIGRWRVLAVAGRVLESIRASYETERQPETLQEASGYFSQMTQGHYRRVWTPVGERTLRVEDVDGHGLAVEILSRGVREQLFLSLRLALAAYYARRGAVLPLILDDVLVNFDLERARAAAQVFATLPRGTRCSFSPVMSILPRFSAA